MAIGLRIEGPATRTTSPVIRLHARCGNPEDAATSSVHRQLVSRLQVDDSRRHAAEARRRLARAALHPGIFERMRLAAARARNDRSR
jgi:hypothetical protein